MASKLSIPHLSPFAPMKVPQSILAMSKKQMEASSKLRENSSNRSPLNDNSALQQKMINVESTFIETNEPRYHSTLLNQ